MKRGMLTVLILTSLILTACNTQEPPSIPLVGGDSLQNVNIQDITNNNTEDLISREENEQKITNNSGSGRPEFYGVNEGGQFVASNNSPSNIGDVVLEVPPPTSSGKVIGDNNNNGIPDDQEEKPPAYVPKPDEDKKDLDNKESSDSDNEYRQNGSDNGSSDNSIPTYEIVGDILGTDLNIPSQSYGDNQNISDNTNINSEHTSQTQGNNIKEQTGNEENSYINTVTNKDTSKNEDKPVVIEPEKPEIVVIEKIETREIDSNIRNSLFQEFNSWKSSFWYTNVYGKKQWEEDLWEEISLMSDIDKAFEYWAEAYNKGPLSWKVKTVTTLEKYKDGTEIKIDYKEYEFNRKKF